MREMWCLVSWWGIKKKSMAGKERIGKGGID
jgi:hypothetical protein